MEIPFNVDDVVLCMLQVVRMIVSHPEDVRAEIVAEADFSTICISVNQQDLGYIIGRKGRTARSLRVLLSAFTGRLASRVTLDLVASSPVQVNAIENTPMWGVPPGQNRCTPVSTPSGTRLSWVSSGTQ